MDKTLVQRVDAALPLDQLQQDGAHVMSRHFAHPIHGGGGVAEAVGEGEEIVVEHLLAGGGQGVQRPAVEGLL